MRLVLQTRDEAEAIRRANDASKRTAKAIPVAAALPPVATILSPAEGSHFSGDTIEIAYALRSPSGLPIDRLDVLADGEKVEATGFRKDQRPRRQGPFRGDIAEKGRDGVADRPCRRI